MALEPLKINIEVNKAEFEKQLKGAETFARDTKKAIDQNMKIQLEFNIANFQSKLQEVKTALKTATWDSKINLQIESNQLQRGLTESKRQLNNLVNTGDASTSRLQQKFDKLWGDMNTSMTNATTTIWQKFTNLWSTIASAFTKAFAVVWTIVYLWRTITDFFGGMISAAQESERAITQLDAALQATGKSAYTTTAEIQAMAVWLAELNSIDDDTYVAMSALALRMQNIWADVLPQFLQAVTDITVAQNWWVIPSTEELTAWVTSLWKALSNPENAMKKLRKAWVEFTKTEWEAIQTALKHNDIAKAQWLILQKLQWIYGWSMAKALTTLDWKQAELSRRWGEMKEQLGWSLIPFLSQTIWYFLKFWDAVSNASTKILWFLDNLWRVALKSALPVINKVFWTSFYVKPKETATTTHDVATTQKPELNLESLFWSKITWWGWSSKVSQATKDAEKAVEDLKDTFKSAYWDINSIVDESKWKIDDYTKEIKDLNDEIATLKSDKDKDIAGRVSEIDQEKVKLAQEVLDLTKEKNNADDNIQQAKIQQEILDVTAKQTALDKERAEAFAWLTAEETKLLQAKIVEQEKYDALTEIGKIKADYDAEKIILEQKLKDKEELLKQEEALYVWLKRAKLQLEADYTIQFKWMIEEQKLAVSWLIGKYNELASARTANALASASSTTTNNTTNKNTTVNAVVSNPVNLNSLVTKLKK